METVNEISYEVGVGLIRFFDVTLIKKDDTWQYVEDMRGRRHEESFGTLYEKFIKKVDSLKNQNRISEIDAILCSEAYAAELYANGFFTENMINSIEEKVNGAGRDMSPFIGIPKQEVTVGGQVISIRMVIVPSVSYNSFVFIDKDSKDM